MIFYFTGTGNSLYVAKELDTQSISIPQVMDSVNLDFTDDSIGIVCPIYGHEMPAMVKKFIQKAVFQTDYLHMILTYGNRHANAVELANKVFRKAGKEAHYITTILMVDNFLPAFDMSEQIEIDKKVESQIAAIKTDIQQKKHEIQKVTLKDRTIHKMYQNHVGNQPETVWTAYKVTEECVGCGICVRVCPAGCIYLENQKAVHTMENCQACMACVHACPKMAVQFTIKEVNPKARYRNEHVSLSELVAANNQNKENDVLSKIR